MVVILFWGYLLFLCWNHALYRAYATLTWGTLYHDMQPTDWRNYKIDEALRTHRGWIA